MNPLLDERHRQALRGPLTPLDTVHLTLSCRSCARYVDDPSLRVLPGGDYRDLEGLIERARVAGVGIYNQPAPDCPECGGKTLVAAVDVHAWHQAMGRDLVVRVHRQLLGLSTELLWWTPNGGYQQAPALTERQRHGLKRDACFRAVRAAAERGGIRAALGAIEEAVQFHRGDRELLCYAPQLLGAGKADLTGHIASLHMALHRDDAEGYFWLAMAIYDNVNRGVLSAQLLKQAEMHLSRALELKPNFPEAACGLCRVARARRSLERDASVALAWFVRAEALAPSAAEWPLGQARALARLGRFDEAEAALARARRLDPKHPQLRAVESSLVRDQPTLKPNALTPDMLPRPRD